MEAGATSAIETVRAALADSIATQERLLDDGALLQSVCDAATRVGAALAAKRRVFFFGNGGSAADAQHLAAELTGRLRHNRPGLPGLALTTDSSALTAIANDFSFDEVFERQLLALAHPGDVAIGISTSGASENVRRALSAGRASGLVTIALTGAADGTVAAAAELVIRVPSSDTQRIQECHILLGHAMLELAEQLVLEGSGAGGMTK
jgi:D-sedoheptulose 7-phosphate isomerase